MALQEELVEEVLLRFPPAEPASFVRAALVCKPWCRVISGRRFCRGFREFHRSPPMLGFICSMFDDNDNEDCVCVSRFVPTSSFCPLHADHGGRVLDAGARHGRVLLLPTYTEGEGETDFLLLVWDQPATTDERWELPTAPVGPSNHDVSHWNATVLCAATASAACNHLDCQGGPFMVVSVGITTNQVSALCVYSSQVGAWSERTLLPKCFVDETPTALVGNTLYFSIEFGDMVLAYDLATRETSVIRLPLPPEHYKYATALTWQ
ncbi:hypothetical protein U9M48_017122 [Paspalum notatum var. saurae]|uniref:F-box domain-containing protein n=1 Tax=Paspalum notatum var. saurae TaxID=547442 RepID=A0AAQ3WNI6_PASNO